MYRERRFGIGREAQEQHRGEQMSLDDDLGITREHVEMFMSTVDADLRDDIEVAYIHGDAAEIMRVMAAADAVMGERDGHAALRAAMN